MIFFSPLEPFEVLLFKPMKFGFFDISLNSTTIYLFLLYSILFGLFWFATSYSKLIPTNQVQFYVELFYKFILSLVKSQTGSLGVKFFPIFFIIFPVIAISNLWGLTPYSFTVTAQFVITFSLALMFNLAFTILGFRLHGFKFLKLFVPSDAPIFLLPLIVVIEIGSYLIRTFSLSIRLFANMMAGHTLLHILATFTILMLHGTFIFFFIPYTLVFAVFLLEIAIAFIQAYVFTILLSIYLNDSFHPGHLLI